MGVRDYAEKQAFSEDFLMVDLKWVDDERMLKYVDFSGDMEGGSGSCDDFRQFGDGKKIV